MGKVNFAEEGLLRKSSHQHFKSSKSEPSLRFEEMECNSKRYEGTQQLETCDSNVL